MPLHLEKTVAGISSSNCLQPSLSEKGEFRKQIPLEGKWCQLLSAQRECIWPQHVWRKYKKCRIPYYKWDPKNIEVRFARLLCLVMQAAMAESSR